MAADIIIDGRQTYANVPGHRPIEIPLSIYGHEATTADDTGYRSHFAGRESPAFDAAFGKFVAAERLSLFTTEVMATRNAEIYLAKWNSFLGKFMGKAFGVRALLEAAANAAKLEGKGDDLAGKKRIGEPESIVIDNLAIDEIGKMNNHIKSALAFLRLDDAALNTSWARDFVGMQMEQLNTVMTMIGIYPHMTRVFDGEKLNGKRRTAIEQLARLMDPLDHIRSVETSHAHFTSLTVDLPTKGVDLFVAHPDGTEIDFGAVAQNAASYMYLRNALDDVIFTGGRYRGRETHLTIGYSARKHRFLITDNMPTAQALMPYGSEPAYSRLWSLIDRMGEGATMAMKPAIFKTTIGAIAIRASDNLVPPKPVPKAVPDTAVLNFSVMEAAREFGGVVEDEDSGIMKPTEESGEVCLTKVTLGEEVPANTNPIDSIFAEITEETGSIAGAVNMIDEAILDAAAVQTAAASAALCANKA